MFDNLKRERSYLDEATAGVGSLSSYYESVVDDENPTKRPHIQNVFAGPDSLFPQLDVMEGSASAFNQAYADNWALTPARNQNIDVAKLIYEETLGALAGFHMNNKTSFEDEVLPTVRIMNGVYDIENENVNTHAAQAPHGMHPISEEVAAMSKNISIQHAMGSSQRARHHGLQRGQNPAVNGTDGEEAFHNSEDIPANSETTIPMDNSVIHINDMDVHVEETMQAMDGNV